MAELKDLADASNVKVANDGKTLKVEIDLTVEGESSKTGKSLVIATTRGNRQVGENLFLGVNLYEKKPKR